MNKMPSETDWQKVDQMAAEAQLPFDAEDGPYDPNDATATREWLTAATVRHRGKVVRRGPQKAPTKRLVSLRLSPEVLEHFKASGPGWQTRIDEALREAVRGRG